MIRIEEYTQKLIDLLKHAFSDRLVYVGLQGSYLRQEATDTSDIDIMAVIDDLDFADLDRYRSVLEKAGNYELSCGFLCGKDELANWNPLEICHLTHTTKDLFGSLKDLVPVYTEQDERKYIQFSINTLYHEVCHARIHSDETEQKSRICACFKSLFFILQNICYLSTGVFPETKKKLLNAVTGEDKDVFKRSLAVRSAADIDSGRDLALLFHWCQRYTAEF